MPTRIQLRFAELQRAQRAGLITFITAGDPDRAATLANMHALVRAGADLLELGIPFSDPMADGPIIQRASERALAAGMTLAGVLDLVSEFRRNNSITPVVLMGYLNPIERMGYPTFATRAMAAGVDGVLTVDLPPEEASECAQAFSAVGLDQIYSLAPTSDLTRMHAVAARASGFVYYVSVKGVTGDKTFDIDEVRTKIAMLKSTTNLPIGVRFGVKTPAIAAALGRVCDAVIVGSALVEIIERCGDDAASALEQFVASLRAALDTSRAA